MSAEFACKETGEMIFSDKVHTGRHTMQLRVILEPSDEGGYTAVVPSLPGCISEGDSREEALQNVQEAIGVYLESVEIGRAHV